MPDTLDEAPVAPSTTAESPIDPQVEALKQHNQQLIGEKRKVQAQLDELKQQLQSIQEEQTTRKQQQLKDSGEFKTLWEQASATNAELQKQLDDLRKQLEQRDQEAQRNLQRTQFLSKAAGEVLAPDQLYRLVEENLKLVDGRLVALRQGIEVDLDRYMESLKSPGSGYEHFFRASGAVGMGTTAQAPAAAVTSGNPYLSGNFTEMVRLEAENPELAAQLQAEAARARKS
jgi:exonuclease VII large subunit